MARRSSAVWTDRSVLLGRYWRSSPFVFSFEPRCQGLRKLSTLLRQFGGEFQVFVAVSSSGLLIHVVVGSCGGVGGLDTNRSGCAWKAASKVTARCCRTSSAVP
jgi:hypothetical protein